MQQTVEMLAAWIQDLMDRGLGPVRVQVSADFYVDFPVEVFSVHGPVYIEPSDLDLHPELVADLLSWQRWFDQHTDSGQEPIERGGAEEWADWRKTATMLAKRMQHDLGPGFEVFAPDTTGD